MVKLVTIQFVDGEKYRGISEQLTIKHDTIYANKGSVFSADGSLLATSMSQYEIRMDVMTVNAEVFEKNVKSLSVELSKMFGRSTSYWETKIRKGRSQKNRFPCYLPGQFPGPGCFAPRHQRNCCGR
jgi:cell division protein FtsI (penicillin-binding protein 3)